MHRPSHTARRGVWARWASETWKTITTGQAEIEFLRQVAKQVAVAVENALNFESEQARQKEGRKQDAGLSTSV